MLRGLQSASPKSSDSRGQLAFNPRWWCLSALHARNTSAHCEQHTVPFRIPAIVPVKDGDRCQSRRQEQVPGSDVILIELYKVSPAYLADFLSDAWLTIARLAYDPTISRSGGLPEKCDSTDPASNHPIMLLYHFRKVISAPIIAEILQHARIHPCQYGLNTCSGKEITTMHAKNLTST